MEILTTNNATIYNNFIITHPTYKIFQIIYDDNFFIEFDTLYNIMKIHIDPKNPIPINKNIFPLDNNIEMLPEGEYELNPICFFNDIPFIVSNLVYNHMISILFISEEIIQQNYVKKIPGINKNGIGDDHYLFLLKSGYIPTQDLKTGQTYQKYSDEDLTNFFRTTKLLYPLKTITNKANFQFIYLNKFTNKKFYSKDDKPYTSNSNSVYLSGAHYAHNMIETLKEEYKDIHFFNTPADWGKNNNWKNIKESNIKNYREYIRYTVGLEDYSRARRDIHSNFGPVLFNVRIPIDFEYATSDTALFIERRLDFFVDQFLSYYTHDHIKLDADLLGDNSNISGFAINWIKDDMMVDDIATNKESNIMENYQFGMHSMKFRAELIVKILRYTFKTPPIMKIIAEIFKDEKTGDSFKTIYTEATEEEKDLIERYYKEGKYLKENQLNILKENNVYLPEEPVEEGNNVEIINENFKN